MGGELHKDVENVLNQVDRMILACKAKGGYKFRERIRLSDKELEKVLAQCETWLKIMAVHLVVAEVMLREPAPSVHSRWEEYERRRAECMAQLGKR